MKENEIKENNVVADGGDEISIKDIFYILKKHLLVIIICTVLGAVFGFAYNKLKAPTYSSNTTIISTYEDYEKAGTSSYTATEYTYLKYLSDTYVELIKEDAVLNETISKLGEKGITVTKAQLKNNIEVSSEALVIKVSFKGADPVETKEIVNALADSLVNVCNKKDEEGKYVYKLLGGNIFVFSEAEDGKKVSHTVRNIAIFCLIGFVLSIAYAFCYELFNNKFKTQHEVERSLGLPVLSEVLYYELDKTPENSPKEIAEEGGNK